MSAVLLWFSPGVYEPYITQDGITVWVPNLTGDPLVGVQVDNVDNGRKFAAVKECLWPMDEQEAAALTRKDE